MLDLCAKSSESELPTKQASTKGSMLAVDDLVIEYRSKEKSLFRAVDRVSFNVERGQRLALVGPSGCGKSSILAAMAGMLEPTSGKVTFGESTPAEARKKKLFGLVPQRDALLHWRTTASNMSLPLELAGKDKQFQDKRIKELLDLFGLQKFGSFYPRELSGGMRSRVAIARALALNPEILLLDECFASLDVLTRERLYKELSPMWSKLGTTMAFITHSVSEAVFLADTIVVLSSHPARVVGTWSVDASQPRPQNFMDSAEFREGESQVRRLLGL